MSHTYEKSIDNEKRSLYLQEKLKSKAFCNTNIERRIESSFTCNISIIRCYCPRKYRKYKKYQILHFYRVIYTWL